MKLTHSKYYRGLGYVVNPYLRKKRNDDIGTIINWGIFLWFLCIICGFFVAALG